MRDIIDPPGLRRIREMHEQLMAVADPPYMRQLREMFDSSQVKSLADMFAGITPAIDPELLGGAISKKLFDDWKLLEPVDPFAGLKALMPAESLSATIAKSWAVDLEAVSALTRTTDIFKSMSLPDYSKELSALAGISTETEKMLASLDMTRGFADLLNINDVTRSLLEYETGRMNLAYAGFGASAAHRPEWLASAPDFVRTAPADIVFAQARFVRTVTTHQEIDEESAADEIWAEVQTQTLGYIEAVLPELNSKLMKSWEGAWDTARRRGPDWARQAASSMRFLVTEALEAVAPVDEVRKSNLPRRYVQNGQILRLGQIHWLCEPVKNRTYGKVVRADLDSAMTIIEAMNEAVHR
ncbi:MAG: hypothetical protein ACREMQ_04205, partial [Longimicrobiales bacterium]